jgi:hypothetical protein
MVAGGRCTLLRKPHNPGAISLVCELPSSRAAWQVVKMASTITSRGVSGRGTFDKSLQMIAWIVTINGAARCLYYLTPDGHVGLQRSCAYLAFEAVMSLDILDLPW